MLIAEWGGAAGQIKLKGATQLHFRVHLGLEEVIRATTVAFRAIECHIRIAQELIGLITVVGRHGDSYAGTNRNLVPEHLEWFRYQLNQACRQIRCIRRPGPSLNYGELVTSQARDSIGAADRHLHTFGDRA